MPYRQLLLKLMDGITDAGTRADIAAAFNAIIVGYASGKLDEDRLKQLLVEFCMDILMEKYPTKDIEELKNEAEDWAEKFYRAVRAATLGSRYFTSSGIRE